jgi:flagellar hook-basal body complex protein FliE
MDGIQPVSGVEHTSAPARTNRVASAPSTEKAKKPSEFAETLDETFGELDELQKEADRKAVGLAVGEVQDVHQVMIALGRADIAFRTMLEVRNRIVEAYKEISRLQV